MHLNISFHQTKDFHAVAGNIRQNGPLAMCKKLEKNIIRMVYFWINNTRNKVDRM